MASSSCFAIAASIAMVSMCRVFLSSPGRVQIAPHAPSVMMRWKSASNSVLLASARATCSAPRTDFRIVMPFSNRSSDNVHLPKELHHTINNGIRLLNTDQVRRLLNQSKLGARDKAGKFFPEFRRSGNILLSAQHQRGLADSNCVLRKVRVPQRATSAEVTGDRRSQQHVGITADIRG